MFLDVLRVQVGESSKEVCVEYSMPICSKSEEALHRSALTNPHVMKASTSFEPSFD